MSTHPHVRERERERERGREGERANKKRAQELEEIATSFFDLEERIYFFSFFSSISSMPASF